MSDQGWAEVARRAAEAEFRGIRADSDDELADDDLHEAPLNPHGSGSSSSGAGGSGMMPPMMMGGGGARGGGASAAGVGVGPAGTDPASAAMGVPIRGAAAPTGLPGGASGAGVGGGALGGGGFGGPMAAGAGGSGAVPNPRQSDFDGGPGASGFPVGMGPDSSGFGQGGTDSFGSDAWSPNTRVPFTPGGGFGDASDQEWADRPPYVATPWNPEPWNPTTPTRPDDFGSAPSDDASAFPESDISDAPPSFVATDGPKPNQGFPGPGAGPSGPAGGGPSAPGGGPAGGGGGGGAGHDGYEADPNELRAAGTQWHDMSAEMAEVSNTNVPSDYGLVGDLGVIDLSGNTTHWSTSAGAEYASIGDKLIHVADEYSQTESANAAEARGL